MKKSYNWSNFYKETVASWRRCETPDRCPDYVSYTGSAYWDFGDRVRRCSDHWGINIATCAWYLEFKSYENIPDLCGECYYEDFNPVDLYVLKTKVIYVRK